MRYDLGIAAVNIFNIRVINISRVGNLGIRRRLNKIVFVGSKARRNKCFMNSAAGKLDFKRVFPRRYKYRERISNLNRGKMIFHLGVHYFIMLGFQFETGKNICNIRTHRTHCVGFFAVEHLYGIE